MNTQLTHNAGNLAPDVILRSGDGQELETHKYLLSYASPVFATMFTLPRGSTSLSPSSDCDITKGGIPVVEMLGDKGKVLERLLEICNPMHAQEERPLNTLEEWKEVFAIAQKFEMRGVENYLCGKLEWFVKKEPLRVFALATQLKKKTVVQKAAISCLMVPIRKWEVLPELESITAGDLLRLQNYHIKCRKSVAAIVHCCEAEAFHGVWFRCTECAESNMSFSYSEVVAVEYVEEIQDIIFEEQLRSGKIRLWWWQFAEGLCEALQEKPEGETVRNSTELVFKALASANECSVCRKEAVGDMAKCIRLLAQGIDERISKITSETVFFQGQ